MYVCIYIHIYIYTYIYTHIHTYIHTFWLQRLTGSISLMTDFSSCKGERSRPFLP